MTLSLEQVHTGLATLRAGRKGRCARLANAIEADYMPRAAMFRSMPLERVRYRLLHADDIFDTEGWQVLVDGCWHSLPMLDERDDVQPLIERCETLGRERFYAPSHAEQGLSTAEIET